MPTTHPSSPTGVLAPLNIDEHALEVRQVADRYSTSINNENLAESAGLDEESRTKNATQYSKNALPEPPKKSLWKGYLEHLLNLFTFMLAIAGSLSIAAFIVSLNWYNLYTGIIFYCVALINAGLEFYQEYRAEVMLRGLQRLVPDKVKVRRNGSSMEIASEELVRGDLLFLDSGDKVPADCRLIHAQGVRLDMSSITGESEPVDRDSLKHEGDIREAACLVFSGARLTSGHAIGIVIRTGADSFLGRIAKLAVSESLVQSQLVQQIEVFVRRIVTIGILLGSGCLALGLARGLPIATAFDVAIGIFVAFLPQGLPATITLLLTIGVQRMAKRHVLAKNVHAVETLGTITLLATDKTGTLTQNKMRVQKVWLPTESESRDSDLQMSEELMQVLSCASICSSSRKVTQEDEEEDQERSLRGSVQTIQNVRIHGDATEVGILEYVLNYFDPFELREHVQLLRTIPFGSSWKYQYVQVKENGKDPVGYVKGAPERISKMCTGFDKNTFDQVCASLARDGLRGIAFGKGTGVPVTKDQELQAAVESQSAKFEMLGLVALRDPPKEGVLQAVHQCRRAGIQVVMVTGDHPLTAEAIARQVGILTLPLTPTGLWCQDPTRAAVVPGDLIDSLSDAEWGCLVRKPEIVFARTLPRHKLEIVRRFQAIGHIVGVTGDGVNDAPALKVADLGISMNESASALTKDVASLILLDDRFATIPEGVEMGRLIYENLKKSIRHIMSHILPVVIGLLVFTITLIPIPITPLLVVVIDLLVDVLPAIAFAWESEEVDLMGRPPRSINNVKRTANIEQETQEKKYSWLVEKIINIYKDPIKGKPLIDEHVFGWAFFQAGMAGTLGAFGGYVVGIAFAKLPWGSLWNISRTYFQSDSPNLLLSNGTIATASEQVAISEKLTTAYFLSIMIVQYCNCLLCRYRHKPPYLNRHLIVNYRIFVAVLISAAIASIIAFVPAIQTVFLTNYPYAASLAPAFAAGLLLWLWRFIYMTILSRRWRMENLYRRRTPGTDLI